MALVGALAWYALALAVAAGSTAVVLLSAAGRRRWWSLALLAALVSLVVWTAFGTVAGYFWLNRPRLERLVADIQAVPAIISLELGDEGSYVEPGRDGDGPPGTPRGRLHRYDSYRFINGTAVTHFPEQAAPGASQPVLYLDDVLRRLHVPAERYWSLRRSLERLSLGDYSHDPGGEVALGEPPVGGQPWGCGYVFSPSGEVSYGPGMQEAWRLSSHWFYVRWG